MATGKRDDQLIQYDNKLELGTSYKLKYWDQDEIGTKNGKLRIGHECVVTMHDANTNDDMTTFTDFHIV